MYENISGLINLSPRMLYLSQIYKDTNSKEPVLLITASGADPSAELRDLALSHIGIERYKEVDYLLLFFFSKVVKKNYFYS